MRKDVFCVNADSKRSCPDCTSGDPLLTYGRMTIDRKEQTISPIEPTKGKICQSIF